MRPPLAICKLNNPLAGQENGVARGHLWPYIESIQRVVSSEATATTMRRRGKVRATFAHTCLLACGHTEVRIADWAPAAVPPERCKCHTCER